MSQKTGIILERKIYSSFCSEALAPFYVSNEASAHKVKNQRSEFLHYRFSHESDENYQCAREPKACRLLTVRSTVINSLLPGIM